MPNLRTPERLPGESQADYRARHGCSKRARTEFATRAQPYTAYLIGPDGTALPEGIVELPPGFRFVPLPRCCPRCAASVPEPVQPKPQQDDAQHVEGNAGRAGASGVTGDDSASGQLFAVERWAARRPAVRFPLLLAAIVLLMGVAGGIDMGLLL